MKKEINHNLISPKIKESIPIEGVKLFTMKTGLRGAFTLHGSLIGGSFFAQKENICIPGIVTALLDHGTKKKSKEIIRNQIEKLGANIRFSSGVYRNSFSVTGLAEDMPFLIRLLAEELREPAFKADDLSLVKKQMVTEFERQKEDTYTQSHRLLMQELFKKGHPNYTHSLDELIELTKKATLSQVRAFHKKYYGLGGLIIVAAGDVNHHSLEKAIQESLKWWQAAMHEIPKIKPSAPKKYKEKNFFIPEKQNVDMYIGIPLGIDDKHKDYDGLDMATFALGGNFSSRLMTNVRKKKGLTYGIYSGLRGGMDGRDGYFLLWGTFAPTLFGQGKEASLLEIKKWVSGGITESELKSKKSTIRNSFMVKMENTAGLTSAILANAEDGRPKSYIDEYLNEIDKLKLKKVNAIIKKYIHPDKLIVASAGSVK